jgi:hypothetical protein
MKIKSLLLIITILACLNFIYFGIQAVDKATAVVQANGFDDLELIDQPLTPTEPKALEEGYRQMRHESQTPKQLKILIDRILEEYPAQIVSIDKRNRYVVIEIYDWMTEGTDRSCELAAECFHAITSLDLTLEVQGSFVPSLVNPMDNIWTLHLVSNDA